MLSDLHIPEYDQPHESQTNKDILETIHRKGLGGGESPEHDGGDYQLETDTSPRNDNAEHDFHNIMNQRPQTTDFRQLQPNFSIQAMTNGQYRDQHPPGLLTSHLQAPTTPVIRMLDMSNTNNYQTHANSPSPRDGNSPPGLHVPGGLSSKDISPVDSPHSLSPPQPGGQPPLMRHSLHLQPAHHLPASPGKDASYTPLTTMSVPGFPASHVAFTQVTHSPYHHLQDLRK